MRGTAPLEPALPHPLRRALGLLRLLHPFPTFLNALVVAAFACIAVRGWPGATRIALLVTAMLCIQGAIGAVNDWADRRLDADAKPWKPVPAGLVTPSVALTTGVLLALAAALLATAGGPAAWLLAMLGLAIGLAYDLGLKRTPLSALTYALALPLVPVWVWTALGEASIALLAAVPVGALLGIALQLANALPDAAGDAAGGVRGTLQWLGPRRGRRLAWAAFAAALLLAGALALPLSLRALPFIPCWLAAAALALATVRSARHAAGPRGLQRGWTLLAAAAALLAVGWLGSLP